MAETSATRPAVLIERAVARSSWRVFDERDGILFLQHESVCSVTPDDWRSRFATLLERWPRTAIVGGKRLDANGRIASMGEFVVHPKGFHHLGRGAEGAAYRMPVEVDAVTGGVLALRTDRLPRGFDLDENLTSPLGALELSLLLRRGDWRVAIDPGVVVTERENAFDANERDDRAFRGRWGFDWRAADLAFVRRHFAGSGLLWNVGVHGRPLAFEKYDHRPLVHWDNYRDVVPYRQRADHIVQLVQQLLASGCVLDLGCGDGLFTHLFAQLGLEAIGVDPEASGIEQARARTEKETYRHAPPRFELAGGESLPIDVRSVHLVTMLDVIEHLDNPVAVLREAHRVLAPGGGLFITTPEWQYGASSDAVYHNFEYTAEELARQVTACGFEIRHTGKIGGAYRDLIVIAQRSNR